MRICGWSNSSLSLVTVVFSGVLWSGHYSSSWLHSFSAREVSGRQRVQARLGWWWPWNISVEVHARQQTTEGNAVVSLLEVLGLQPSRLAILFVGGLKGMLYCGAPVPHIQRRHAGLGTHGVKLDLGSRALVV